MQGSTAKLYIAGGSLEGRSFDIKEESVFIGRGSDSDIQIKDRSISRTHAKIFRKGDKFFIEDLESENGTFVNDSRIKPGSPFEIEEGKPITLGHILITVDKGDLEDGMITKYAIDFSGQAGEIRRKLLYKDRRITNRKNLELIYEVSATLMQSLDINEISEKIMDALFFSFQRINGGVILLVDSKTGDFKEVVARSRGTLITDKINYSKTIVNRVIYQGKAIVMSDTSHEDEDELSESIEIKKIKSIMCTPLIIKSQILGVIYVHSLDVPHGFRKDDLLLLTGLSSPAALAIENALLYFERKKAQEELQKAHDELENRVRDRTDQLSRANALLKNEITARKRTGAELEETNVFLKNILDSSFSISIISTDLKQNILFWNRGAEKIFGYKADEIIGSQKTDILYPDEETKDEINKIKSIIFKNKQPINLEVRELTKDGRMLWINLNLAPRFDAQGHIIGLLGIGEDITLHKQLKEDLQHAQKMESIGTMTSGVSHNFRNILAGISVNNQLLEMKYKNEPEVEKITNRINNAVNRGAKLVEGLLQFSRKKAKKDFQAINLAEIIHEIYQIIAGSFDKSIDIQADVPDLLFINGDHSTLSQVFMNLCTNARDSMPGGGKLNIKARKERGKILVAISDTGFGMDVDTMDKCFDPFFTAKKGIEGTGLGLSTAYGIVKEHGGKILVDSRPGKGTTFNIYFPETSFRGKEEGSLKTITYGKGEKILVVDDEVEFFTPTEELLKSIGYNLFFASNGKTAIKKYKSWKPDAVLLDRNMPEMDGITCAGKILQYDPKARIILMSGYEENGINGIDDKTKAFIKGYFTKPIDITQLSLVLGELFS